MNQQIVDAIRACEKEVEGRRMLFAEDVVETAKSPGSPLHDLFTWDDSEAANQYRLHEARQLIRKVKILVPVAESQELKVSIYHHLPSDEKGYTRIEDVAHSMSMRESLLKQMWSELSAFSEKYKVHSAVLDSPELFDAFDEFAEKLKAQLEQKAA